MLLLFYLFVLFGLVLFLFSLVLFNLLQCASRQEEPLPSWKTTRKRLFLFFFISHIGTMEVSLRWDCQNKHTGCCQYQLADRLHILVLVLQRQEKEMASGTRNASDVEVVHSVSMGVYPFRCVCPSQASLIKSPAYIPR